MTTIDVRTMTPTTTKKKDYRQAISTSYHKNPSTKCSSVNFTNG